MRCHCRHLPSSSRTTTVVGSSASEGQSSSTGRAGKRELLLQPALLNSSSWTRVSQGAPELQPAPKPATCAELASPCTAS
eukprot:1158816-Pelagomonas_calceolata.AAC.1